MLFSKLHFLATFLLPYWRSQKNVLKPGTRHIEDATEDAAEDATEERANFFTPAVEARTDELRSPYWRRLPEPPYWRRTSVATEDATEETWKALLKRPKALTEGPTEALTEALLKKRRLELFFRY